MAERQDDGADHGDEQHEARALKKVDVLRIEQLAQGFGIGDAFGHRGCGGAIGLTEAKTLGGEQHDEFGENDTADEKSHGRILDVARPQFGKVDVQHHDDEEEEHRHRADVDDHEQHGDESAPSRMKRPRR